MSNTSSQLLDGLQALASRPLNHHLVDMISVHSAIRRVGLSTGNNTLSFFLSYSVIALASARLFSEPASLPTLALYGPQVPLAF